MENSNFLSLNWKDIVKSAYMLAITMFVAFLYGVLDSGALPTVAQLLTELKVVGIAVAGYLLKQILSGTTGVPFKKD